MQAEPIATIAHVIQLSVAPVFLLTGIAGLLNVLTGRLARVIDRARVIERDVMSGDAAEESAAHERLRTLAVLIVGLVYFLREISPATSSLRIGRQ
ncbi:MAG: hypothetical protein C0497_14150 [Gemmatimonas sp.]|nr:hypothetical protein [Gemmatimonas sp.]